MGGHQAWSQVNNHRDQSARAPLGGCPDRGPRVHHENRRHLGAIQACRNQARKSQARKNQAHQKPALNNQARVPPHRGGPCLRAATPASRCQADGPSPESQQGLGNKLSLASGPSAHNQASIPRRDGHRRAVPCLRVVRRYRRRVEAPRAVLPSLLRGLAVVVT